MTAFTEIARLDAPVAGVFDFTGLSLTGVKQLQIVCSGITVTTDGTDPLLTFYVSASEVVTGYRWGHKSMDSAANLLVDGDVSDPAIHLVSDNATWDVGNAAGENFGAVITLDQPVSTAFYKRVSIQSAYVNPAGNVVATDGVGVMENAGAIDGVKISGSSNFVAGHVRLLALS